MKNFSSEPAQTMQRVRVGMIGLAAVLLFIGLAAAILTAVSHERPVRAAGASRPDVIAEMSGNGQDIARDKEPLAELGAAPSATPSPKRR